MTLGLVAGRVDPQDPACDRASGNVAYGPRSVVEIRVVPSEGVVDDVDPVVEAVGDGQVEIHLIGNLDQIQLSIRGNVVDDLGDCGSVRYPARKACPGEIVLDSRIGQIPTSLSLAQAGEAKIDDGNLHPASADSRCVEGISPDEPRAFAGRSKSVWRVRRPNERNAPQLSCQGLQLRQ